MNISKLVRHNLAVPMEKRIPVSRINTELARMSGDCAALLATIHIEVAPILEAKRKAERILDGAQSTVSLVLETSPECYGTSSRETMLHYIPAGGMHRLHSPGALADCETEERDVALIRAMAGESADDNDGDEN